jgi:hypothetical protein
MNGYGDNFMWVGPWPGGQGGATTNEMTLIMEGRGGRGGYGPNVTWYPPGAPVLDGWPPIDPRTGMRYIPKPQNYPMGPYGAPKSKYGTAPCPECKPAVCSRFFETSTTDPCGCASGCKTNWGGIAVLGAVGVAVMLVIGHWLDKKR